MATGQELLIVVGIPIRFRQIVSDGMLRRLFDAHPHVRVELLDDPEQFTVRGAAALVGRGVGVTAAGAAGGGAAGGTATATDGGGAGVVFAFPSSDPARSVSAGMTLTGRLIESMTSVSRLARARSAASAESAAISSRVRTGASSLQAANSTSAAAAPFR